MKFKYTLMATSLVASCANAQHNTQQHSPANIETITVLSSRATTDIDVIPGSVSIIDADYIAASGAVFISDLLRSFAGMNISQSGPTGALTEVRFRGSESNHILVMVDGVEINDLGQGGLVDFAHIQTHDIERIELLRGPQSALWGSSAVSGVINIITKGSNNSKGFDASISAELSHENTQRVGLTTSRTQDRYNFGLNLSHYTTEGFNVSRPNSSGIEEKDGYQNTQLSAHYGFQANHENRISFNGRLTNYESEFDTTDFVMTGLPADSNNVSQGQQSSAQIKWLFTPINSIWKQTLSLQHNQQTVENFADDVFDRSTKGSKTRVNWNSQFNITQKNVVNVGFDWVDEDFEQAGQIVFGDPNQKQNNKTGSITSDGLFFITDKLNTTFSVRADKSDSFESANSYRIGINAILSSSLRAFLAKGKAIKNPTFTERFGFFPGSFIGNESLTPEESNNKELGLIYTAPYGNELTLTYFNTELEDEINGFVFVPEAGNFTAQNNDLKSTRQGLEVSATGEVGRVNWQFSYAYLDAKDAQGDELRRAEHTGSGTLRYRHNDVHSGFVQIDYTGSRLDTFFPPFPQPSQIVDLDAYWFVSANYRYQYNKNTTLSFRGSNLLNRTYEDVFGFATQGRRVSVNLRYALN